MTNLLDGCLYYTAGKLDRAIKKMAEEEFAIIGLSPTYGFLMLIVNEKPGISAKDIAQELSVTQSTVTRFIDKLEARNLIRRESQGKFSYAYLTSQGKDMIKTVNEAWKNLYNRYSKILGYDEGDELTIRVNQAADKLLKE